MELSTMLHGRCLVVTVLVPELDHRQSEVFKDAVLDRYRASGAQGLLLDCGNVDFLDSKAIGAMVSIRKQVVANGGRLGLFHLRPHVERIVRMVTLGAIFDIHPDRATALTLACSPEN